MTVDGRPEVILNYQKRKAMTINEWLLEGFKGYALDHSYSHHHDTANLQTHDGEWWTLGYFSGDAGKGWEPHIYLDGETRHLTFSSVTGLHDWFRNHNNLAHA